MSDDQSSATVSEIYGYCSQMEELKQFCTLTLNVKKWGKVHS